MRLAVCRFDERCDTERALLLLSRAGLSAEECERLRCIRHPSARAASVAARLALLWALSDAEDKLSVHDFDELPPIEGEPLSTFRRTERGPLLVGSDLGISFAHSEPLSVCAVVRGCRVGVDVERLDRTVRLPRSIPPFFSSREVALLDAADDRTEVFLRIWTRKEALGKALGTGLHNTVAALDTTAHRFAEYTVESTLISVFTEKTEGRI